MHSIIWFALVLTFYGIDAAPAGDLITHLPGMAAMPQYKQYSGYLTASGTKHFHYWFAEAQIEPSEAPVVLWLNGGPGCSSLDGLLSENGPIHVRPDGSTLYHNPHSWNKLANMLYLESPAQVGFSYDDTGNAKTDDDEVATNNYAALQDFFKKFPEYAKNKFFITGESYGGVYIPTLALKVADGKQFNFQGFAVGNGLSSYKLNENSLVYFCYYHGLFGETLWNNLVGACCKGGSARANCTFHMPTNAACGDYVSDAFNIVYRSGLNEYALYMDCGGPGLREKAYRFTMGNLFLNLDAHLRKKVISQKLHQSTMLGGLNGPQCINSTAIETWLNKKEVRSAIHIPESVQKWEICNDVVNSKYGRKYTDMTATYKTLMNKYPDLRMLIYNGDTDMACNFLGDQWFIADLNLQQIQSRAPWYVKGQVAGFAREFKQLIYTTIRGAGHMVPQWAPEYAYVMFEKFLNNEHFVGVGK